MLMKNQLIVNFSTLMMGRFGIVVCLCIVAITVAGRCKLIEFFGRKKCEICFFFNLCSNSQTTT